MNPTYYTHYSEQLLEASTFIATNTTHSRTDKTVEIVDTSTFDIITGYNQHQMMKWNALLEAVIIESKRGTTGLTTKQKTQKTTAEKTNLYCQLCGKTETPQWRTGPDGPNTYCNSCGIRYKRSQNDPTSKRSRENKWFLEKPKNS